MQVNPSSVINLSDLMATTAGEPDVVIGIIDGPVNAAHPDLQQANLQTVPSRSSFQCESVNSLACQHGTFIAGILCGDRATSPAIATDCTLLVRPIFCESSPSRSCPEVTPDHLATAITDTIAAGAQVINLSLGLSAAALFNHPRLKETCDYALQVGVLLVAASGNQGQVGPLPLFSHPWVIPVVACDRRGRLEPSSNIGPSVGRRGLMAPGVGITSLASGGGYTQMTGTSVAVPFVTGAIALLWSLFPHVSAAEMHRAILRPGGRRGNVIPPLLNAAESWQTLQSRAVSYV
ncbi:MAG: S8 family serine peptidase [Cyanobacteria bacterium P01_F01_bin.150]